MANILGIVAIGVTGIAFIFCIVSLCDVKYSKTVISQSGNTAEFYGSLWRYCADYSNAGGTKTCFDVDSVAEGDDKDYIRACRAMNFLALFQLIGAIVAGVLVLFVLKSTKLLFFVAAGLNIGAGICSMTCMAIFVSELYGGEEGEDSYEIGFAVVIVSWFTAWIAGGIYVGAKIMDKDSVDVI